MTWRFIRKKLGPDYHRLKTTVKRGIEQDKIHLNVNPLMHDNWVVYFAEVYSPEEHRHAEDNPTCEIHKGYCASH